MKIITECGQLIECDRRGFPLRRFDLEVTAHHIEMGERGRGECEMCPLAWALAWALAEFSEKNFLEPWEVYIDDNQTTIWVFGDDPKRRAEYNFKHDSYVTGWINRFDRTGDQAPTVFRFYLERKEVFIIKEVGME